MAANLRVVRMDGTRYSPVTEQSLFDQYDALTALIRRYLPKVNASLLTKPRVLDDGKTVEWYSDLEGQPVPLEKLPEIEQQKARKLLSDRLHALNDLADRLDVIEPGSAHLQKVLKQALLYPADENIFVIEGQPVLTFWGHQRATSEISNNAAALQPNPSSGALKPDLINPAAADLASSDGAPTEPTDSAKTRRSGFPRWLLWLFLSAVIAGLLAFFWDRLPFKEWFAPDYWAMYQEATGDCDKIQQLQLELNHPDTIETESLPLVKAAVSKELQQCETPDYWALYQAATGDCEKIKALQQTLNQPDVLPAPELPAVKEAVLKESQQCDVPDYWAMYQAATGDCEKIKILEQQLNQPDVIESPDLPDVKAKVTAESQQCDLPDYLAMYEAAKGDCEKIAELQQYLANPDLPVTEALPIVREQVQKDYDQCRIKEFQALLDQSKGDCDKLRAAQPKMTEIASAENDQLKKIYAQFQTEMAQCQLSELQDQFNEAKQDCAQLKGFAASIGEQQQKLQGYDTFKKQLDQQIAECNKPKPVEPAKQPEAKPPEQKPAEKTTQKDPRQLCPGERPKELAPDLALVFDASNSMNDSMSMGALGRMAPNVGGALGLGLGILNSMSEKRIDVAKKAAGSVISGLPRDVDAGLVLVNECPSARKEGFYSPQERGQLVQKINRIRTVGGTPLASGIQSASEMIDGVTAPAVIVVISDGSESCHGDPCAVARNLARTKPLLKINVVDIMGTGAANCVAAATGGRVFKANNASDLQVMLNTAVEEVKGPANCIKR